VKATEIDQLQHNHLIAPAASRLHNDDFGFSAERRNQFSMMLPSQNAERIQCLRNGCQYALPQMTGEDELARTFTANGYRYTRIGLK
jgi:hypothetical protein